MTRGATLLAATLAAMSLGDAPPRERVAPPKMRKGENRRPKPQRYFGGRSARKMTRMLRRQEGKKP